MTRLSLVSLIVPDQDAAIGWFDRALDWPVRIDTPQGDKRWIVVGPKEGGTGLVLAPPRGAEQASFIGRQGGGRVWLFLETSDFEAARDRLAKAGTNLDEEPRHEPYGTVDVFTDPWGNRWDLIQPA